MMLYTWKPPGKNSKRSDGRASGRMRFARQRQRQGRVPLVKLEVKATGPVQLTVRWWTVRTVLPTASANEELGAEEGLLGGTKKHAGSLARTTKSGLPVMAEAVNP